MINKKSEKETEVLKQLTEQLEILKDKVRDNGKNY